MKTSRLKIFGWAAYLAAQVALIAIVCIGPNADDFFRIENGMTKSEVEAIVGKPHHVRRDGAWFYDLRNFSGDVAVRFDDDERVWMVDDLWPDYD
jgi:hypothetical protein